MKLKHVFSKKLPTDETTRIIRDEMLFLLERNERWFTKNLQAHLLNEGCNYPLCLAKPLFYDTMISGLFSKANSTVQKKCQEELVFPQNTLSHDAAPSPEQESLVHEEFYIAMRFFEKHLDNSGKQMALEVTNP